MARISYLNESEDDWGKRSDESFDEWIGRTTGMLEELSAVSDAITVDQPDLAGYLYTHPMGDGRAYYLVTGTRPLIVASIPYLDAWELPAAHVRGLTEHDIRQHILTNTAMRRLFSGISLKLNRPATSAAR